MNLPKARLSDIIEQETDRELLIYDLQSHKAYSLNETSKIVYKACGKKTVDDLKRQYKFTDDLIYLTLDELAANNLIENYQNDHFANLTRREVIKKVGLSTMIALPVIIGLNAPKAIQAASNCRTTGTPVSATNSNPSSDTTQNQNAIAPKLSAQCCNNSYNTFISNGCSNGIGQTCFAQAICN